MKKILLVEDDAHLRKIIETSLSTEYQITTCQRLSETLTQIEKSTFDVVIMDRKLPDGDAIEVVEYLAATHFQTKIIVISSLHQVADKIHGLELGADDYLPKPFSIGELKLKVAKTCQYIKQKTTDQFSVGDLLFTPSSGEIVIGSDVGRLRKKEADILSCLFKYKNQVVSRDLLVDEVWTNFDSVPTQTTLDVYIRRIRMSLKKYKSIIVTKRGFGYMLTDHGN